MVGALVLFVGPLAARSSPDPRDNAATARQETGEVPEEAVRLERIVVAATRTERAQFTTPAAISTIGREQIEAIQPYGYQDVFESVPGVNIVGGPRRIAEEPSIRGFADEQVVIRIDGTRQNFNKAHGGRFLLDPALIKSVEVMRGAGSAIYGSGALGGVFVIESASGRDLTGGQDGVGLRQKLGYRNNGDEWTSFTSVYGQAGSLDVVGSLVYRDVGEDLRDGSGTDILATRDEVTNGMIKVGFEPDAFQRIELAVDRFENTGLNPTNSNEPATATNLVDRDTERSNARLRYSYNDPTNRWLDLNVVAYNNDVQTRELRLDDNRLDRTDFETAGFEVTNTSEIGDIDGQAARLTWGVDLYGDEQRGTRNGQSREQFPQAEVDYRAGFVQAELPLPGKFALIPGVRFDRFEYRADGEFENRNDDRTTPRLALGWQPLDPLYLWAEYAEAFRAPSLTELFADGVHFIAPLAPGQVVINEFVPTPDLRPESSVQYQLGARVRQRGLFGSDLDLEIEMTAYRSEVEDFVDQFVEFISGPPVFDPVTQTLVFPGITSNRNVDARIDGAEFGIRLDGPRGYLRAAATTIDGRRTDGGGDLASIQPDRVSLGAGFWMVERQLLLGAELTASADRRDVPEGGLETAGYGKTDVFVSYLPNQGALAGFEFRVAFDNVFNKDYRIHPNGIDQPGRSVRLSVARDFQWLR